MLYWYIYNILIPFPLSRVFWLLLGWLITVLSCCYLLVKILDSPGLETVWHAKVLYRKRGMGHFNCDPKKKSKNMRKSSMTMPGWRYEGKGCLVSARPQGTRTMFLSVYVLQKDALSNLGAVDVNRDRQKIKDVFQEGIIQWRVCAAESVILYLRY